MSWQYTISGHSSYHLHWFNIGFEMGRVEVWNGGYKILKPLAEHVITVIKFMCNGYHAGRAYNSATHGAKLLIRTYRITFTAERAYKKAKTLTLL